MSRLRGLVNWRRTFAWVVLFNAAFYLAGWTAFEALVSGDLTVIGVALLLLPPPVNTSEARNG